MPQELQRARILRGHDCRFKNVFRRRGAEGIRTLRLFAASEALYQMSYCPKHLVTGPLGHRSPTYPICWHPAAPNLNMVERYVHYVITHLQSWKVVVLVGLEPTSSAMSMQRSGR